MTEQELRAAVAEYHRELLAKVDAALAKAGVK